MKNKLKPHHPQHHKKMNDNPDDEDMIDKCIRKGLIEKTKDGYIFKPEFFETLEVYEE